MSHLVPVNRLVASSLLFHPVPVCAPMRLPMCYPVVAPAFLTQAADFRSSLLPMDMSSLVASSRQRRNPSLGQQEAVHFLFVMFVAVSTLRPVTMLDTMVAMPN